MDSILNLSKKDLDRLEKRYGDLFFKEYKRELEQTIEHQEMLETLLAHKGEPKDERPYGSLLDKYIK